MSWNLVWIPTESANSEFAILLGDEPVLTKKMFGQIAHGSDGPYLTFVESMYRFSFEDCNEFINDLEVGKQAKISFDVWDGEEAFAYDETNETLGVTLSSYSSNMTFTIPMVEKTRIQFAAEFRKFLAHYLKYYESDCKKSSQISPQV